MDKDKSGVLDVGDIRQLTMLNSTQTWKLIRKLKTILIEFLDTFEKHYSLNHEGTRDHHIDMDGWI